MWNSFFLSVFLPCAGIVTIYAIYKCLLWFAGTYNNHLLEYRSAIKSRKRNGISPSDLEKLPRITGKDLGLPAECAVCLDDIGSDQPVRLIPGCNHGFRLQCADTWLSKQSICPVCRAELQPELLNSPDCNPC